MANLQKINPFLIFIISKKFFCLIINVLFLQNFKIFVKRLVIILWLWLYRLI